MVMALARDQQVSGQKYLLRATSQGFMSHNNFSCACASVPKDTRAVVLDMGSMNRVLQFNDDQETVTVQAGITFQELERVLLEYDMSLPGVVVAPALGGITLGAAIVTAAHGSSLVGPAGVAPFLHSALLVDGTGDIHTLESPGQLLEGSLGLLGVVAEVTLYVGPRRKVAVRHVQSEDFDLVSDLREIIDGSDALALDVTWDPTAGMYRAALWHEADAAQPGDARNAALRPPAEWLARLGDRVHRDQLDPHDREGVMCEVLGEMAHMPAFVDPSGAGAGGEPADPAMAVGWLNRMASAWCEEGEEGQAGGPRPAAGHPVRGAPPRCLLRAVKLTPFELAIHSQDFAAWLADARAILRHAQGCPPFLFTFRFVGESDAALAPSAGRQAVAIALHTLSSPHATGSGLPLKFGAVAEELLQMSLCAHGGRPHWALAPNRLFRGAPCDLRDSYGAAFDRFLELQRRYDPARLFSPPLWEEVVGRARGGHYPGCAARQDCWCESDEHCGAGHRCVPGAVFTEYRVCAPLPERAKAEL